MKGWTHVEGKEITDENNDEVGPIYNYTQAQVCIPTTVWSITNKKYTPKREK